MKSGALDALIEEVRTSEIDFFSPSSVEHFIEKAFFAGKQVAFGQARAEVIESCAGDSVELSRKIVEEILKRLEMREQLGAAVTHIDDWVYNHSNPSYPRWMFLHFRLPAVMKPLAREFIPTKLFCKFYGKIYRVVGAGRMGEIWLTDDYEEDTKYHLTADVDECSEWSDHV